jgi:hypothetical protein
MLLHVWYAVIEERLVVYKVIILINLLFLTLHKISFIFYIFANSIYKITIDLEEKRLHYFITLDN